MMRCWMTCSGTSSWLSRLARQNSEYLTSAVWVGFAIWFLCIDHMRIHNAPFSHLLLAAPARTISPPLFQFFINFSCPSHRIPIEWWGKRRFHGAQTHTQTRSSLFCTLNWIECDKIASAHFSPPCVRINNKSLNKLTTQQQPTEKMCREFPFG